MKLRTLIFIFLLVFGLAPLVSSVLLNLPLVVERIELFYQKAYLQNLRADFRDLDQHLASRNELMRLLAKLPEPGLILGDGGDADQIDHARARYTAWINQILREQVDVTQLLFLDADNRERFWLERDPKTQRWHPTTTRPERPADDFLEAARRLQPGGVLVSPIHIHPESGAEDPRRFMNLYLMSAIGSGETPGRFLGSLLMAIDVGGMAQFYHNTLWVTQDGSYLRPGESDPLRAEAFVDFPGLQQIFSERKLSLWKGSQGNPLIWVPMFTTEKEEPLWVGRAVDPSPIAAFRNALILRVVTIVCVVTLILLLVARWVSLRLERFGQQLTEGVGRVLSEDAPMEFAWKGPEELRALGTQLTTLAQTHAEHVRALRTHAEELERSYRYKSEFLANISHELRTPLNSILLLSKLLADGRSGLRPEQQEQARVIHEAGSDLRDMIDNILDISRIEAGRVELNLEWAEVSQVVGEVIELLQPQFADKGLYLGFSPDPSAPPRVCTDWDKVRQILKNFLSNAAKFTAKGGARVEITPSGDPERGLSISVCDSGIGIPADKQGLIFEAFRQADGSTRRRYGGSGLGLTISRELAYRLGGVIELESAEGRGACFRLLLPIELRGEREPLEAATAPATQLEPRAVAPFAAPRRPQPQGLERHSVLVVEQDARLLMEITPRLEALGLRVLAAVDTEEAVETLREEPQCALVLVDAMLPEEEIRVIINMLRREWTPGQLPILVMAPDSEQTRHARLREMGAEGLLPVPIDDVHLREALGQYLPAVVTTDGL